jgi:NAD(P)H-dependent FMN reductase
MSLSSLPHDPLVQVLVVNGSSSAKSSVRAILQLIARKLGAVGATVDLLDLAETPLPIFNPDNAYTRPDYAALKKRVELADVLLLGTPDYHGCVSGALKNFLDHFWTEYAGKLIASVVASYDKGLTVSDQIRTVARQCYAWSLPYAVNYADRTDVKDGEVINEAFAQRLDMLAHDIRTYGALIAQQRRADLTSHQPGFMALFRPAAGGR